MPHGLDSTLSYLAMIESAGARAGMIAPDETTYAYLRGRPRAPQGAEWERAVERGRQLPSDAGARFDKEVEIDGASLEPMQTGCGALPRVEQLVELGERTTANQGKRSFARGRKPHDQRGQTVRYLNQFRAGSDFEQRPVDIEEQSR